MAVLAADRPAQSNSRRPQRRAGDAQPGPKTCSPTSLSNTPTTTTPAAQHKKQCQEQQHPQQARGCRPSSTIQQVRSVSSVSGSRRCRRVVGSSRPTTSETWSRTSLPRNTPHSALHIVRVDALLRLDCPLRLFIRSCRSSWWSDNFAPTCACSTCVFSRIDMQPPGHSPYYRPENGVLLGTDDEVVPRRGRDS